MVTPFVDVAFTGLPGSVNTITVYRLVGGTPRLVRGGLRKYAVGGATVADYEAPFGIPLTYRAEMFDISGYSLGYTSNITTSLNVAETWIHNPLDPSTGVAVTMEGAAVSKLTRPTAVDVRYPIGRGLGTAVSGQRRALADVDLSFLTFTDADADRVEAMFGNPYDDFPLPPVVCVRTGVGKKMRLPQPLHVACDIDGLPLDGSQAGSTIQWAVTGQEVIPPAAGIIAPDYTLADLDAAYSTLADIDAAYLTLLDIDRAYGLAGYA